MSDKNTAQNQQKIAAATRAIEFLTPGAVVGIGSGTTVAYFIELLGAMRGVVAGVVIASSQSEVAARRVGLPIVALNNINNIPTYFDSADEIDAQFAMIKGGGAALTREKIIGAACRRFICIVDASKVVRQLGAFPLPIEIIPMASRYVASRIEVMGGVATLRNGVITDNGNAIVDVTGLDLTDPVAVESEINQIPGVVCNGIFARRRADICIVGGESVEVRTLNRAGP
jgi:ribose 5-phosphate isomerase A